MTNSNRHKISYLACPFTHPDPQIQAERLNTVNQFVAEKHQSGEFIYSPLTHNITLAKHFTKKASWETWEKFDKAMLQRCDELIVLTLTGWETSRGVQAEIAFAKEINLPIKMMELL